MGKNWIAGATSNAHGQFAAKAKAAGKTTAAYAAEKADAPGRTGKQARLAKTLMGMHKSADGSVTMGAMTSKQGQDVAKGHRTNFTGKGQKDSGDPGGRSKSGYAYQAPAAGAGDYTRANAKNIGHAKDGGTVGSGGMKVHTEQRPVPGSGPESSGAKIRRGLDAMHKASGGMVVKSRMNKAGDGAGVGDDFGKKLKDSAIGKIGKAVDKAPGKALKAGKKFVGMASGGVVEDAASDRPSKTNRTFFNRD